MNIRNKEYMTERRIAQLKKLHEYNKNLPKKGGYQAIHKWLKYTFGIANKCENPNCEHKHKRFHWALKKGCKYEYKIENFIMLCPTCHRRYDITTEQKDRLKKQSHKMLGENNYNAVLNINKVKEIKLKLYQKYTIKSLAKEYGVSLSTIQNIKHNKTWRYV